MPFFLRLRTILYTASGVARSLGIPELYTAKST